jgi:hypothetical protein
MEQGIQEKTEFPSECSRTMRPSVELELRKVTKAKLDGSKAFGQGDDEFINQLIDYWERYRIGSSLCGPGRPLRRDVERG